MSETSWGSKTAMSEFIYLPSNASAKNRRRDWSRASISRHRVECTSGLLTATVCNVMSGKKKHGFKIAGSSMFIDSGRNVNHTSTRATNAVAIIANDSPASNVGAPHWNGYGILILQNTIADQWIIVIVTPLTIYQNVLAQVEGVLSRLNMRSEWHHIMSFQTKKKTPYHGAPLMIPARSVLQLSWVFTGAFLYAPPTVNRWAYIHTITTENSTANRSKTCWFPFIMWGIYCKKWKMFIIYNTS